MLQLGFCYASATKDIYRTEYFTSKQIEIWSERMDLTYIQMITTLHLILLKKTRYNYKNIKL